MANQPLPKAAEAKHLTTALKRSGALADGRVSEVLVESSRPTLLSRILRLRLSYEGGAHGPASLILKTGLPERAQSKWGSREVEFYGQVASEKSTRFIPRCFEAAWDADEKTWHLLLEDLTDTHEVATVWPLPPSQEQCERIVYTLARLQAQWWDDARFGVSIGWPDAAVVNETLKGLVHRYKTFADLLGDRLSSERRELYERFLNSAPHLLARYLSRRNLSIVHGDAHVWNFFQPRNGTDDVRIFDWDAWRVGVPSTDLAYMMATHWYPDRRRWLEGRLLDHYHATLVACGVRGYDRPALDDDYRLSVLWQILTPVWQATSDLPPMIWWSHLERTMLAVDDLGCRELLP